MHFLRLSNLAALTLISTSSARITGMGSPSNIAAGEPFNVTLLTSDYIQTVYDVAVAFGITPLSSYHENLGTVLASFYIGPKESNTLKQLIYTLTVDQDYPKGKAMLTASLMSLYGASSEPVLKPFNITITVGDCSSEGVGCGHS